MIWFGTFGAALGLTAFSGFLMQTVDSRAMMISHFIAMLVVCYLSMRYLDAGDKAALVIGLSGLMMTGFWAGIIWFSKRIEKSESR